MPREDFAAVIGRLSRDRENPEKFERNGCNLASLVGWGSFLPCRLSTIIIISQPATGRSKQRCLANSYSNITLYCIGSYKKTESPAPR